MYTEIDVFILQMAGLLGWQEHVSPSNVNYNQ